MFRSKSKIFFVLTFLLFSNLFAFESNREGYFKAEAAPRNLKNSNSSSKTDWSPSFCKSNAIWSSQNFFVTNNIGIGFLYFSGLKGSGLENGADPTWHRASDQDFGRRHLCYNRTPLYEGALSWKIFHFMTAGVFYTGQSNIHIETLAWVRTPPNHNAQATYLPFDFKSDVDLNALGLKVGFFLPISYVRFSVGCTPYLNLFVGPSWQSWANVSFIDTTNKIIFTYRPKISANCFFGTDLGLRFQNVNPGLRNMVSVVIGCKFNIWGQARSIGKKNQQLWRGGLLNPVDASGRGDEYYLQRPISIKTVYQFAPYIGFALGF